MVRSQTDYTNISNTWNIDVLNVYIYICVVYIYIIYMILYIICMYIIPCYVTYVGDRVAAVQQNLGGLGPGIDHRPREAWGTTGIFWTKINHRKKKFIKKKMVITFIQNDDFDSKWFQIPMIYVVRWLWFQMMIQGLVSPLPAFQATECRVTKVAPTGISRRCGYRSSDIAHHWICERYALPLGWADQATSKVPEPRCCKDR